MTWRDNPSGERAGGIMYSESELGRATAICRCNFVVKGIMYRELSKRRDHHDDDDDDDDITDREKYQI